MPKKILVFSLAYYPSFVSGAEAAIKEITDRIEPNQIEFHLITHLFEKDAKRVETIGNVTVYRVGFGNAYLSKILFIPFAAFKAKAIHRKEKVDGIWAMMTYMLFPLVLARLIGMRQPYVLTLQDGDPYEKVFKRWFIRPFTLILNFGFRHATVIQVISGYLGTWPKKRGYKGKVVLVRNGANPKNFMQTYSNHELEVVKQSLGKKEGDVYLFIAARLTHQKAQDDIITSLTFLPNHIHLLIAGAGEDETKLKDLVKDLHFEGRVRFLGSLERDDVPKYRNTIVSDIFVHPSRSEGLGNSILSAMAACLPVITTQVGGLADYIFDEKRNPDKKMTAWAVNPDSPKQIASAVLDILAHPEKVREVTTHARAMVLKEYDWNKIAKQMHTNVFNKLWT